MIDYQTAGNGQGSWSITQFFVHQILYGSSGLTLPVLSYITLATNVPVDAGDHCTSSLEDEPAPKLKSLLGADPQRDSAVMCAEVSPAPLKVRSTLRLGQS